MKRIGALLLLVGVLFSPIKQFMLRCYWNPWDIGIEQCEQFRLMYSEWGFLPLAFGLLLLLWPRTDKETHD